MSQTYRLLLDENVDRRVQYQLDYRGHDVRCVGDGIVETGSSDETIATVAEDTDRILLSHDDDFLRVVEAGPDVPCLLVERDPITPAEIGQLVDRLAATVPPEHIDGVFKIGRSLL